MSRTINLSATKRDNHGSTDSRRLRHTGQIPGVIYGGGEKENENIVLRHDDVYHALERGGFFSTIIDVAIDGEESQEVFAKDVQRHPFKPFILHVDFQRIKRGEEMTIEVPLHAINDDKCVGVKEGGILSQMVNSVSVTCRPRNIPEHLEVDVAELNINESVHLSNIVLPEDVKLTDIELGHDDVTVMAVLPPKLQTEEEVDEAPETEVIGEETADSEDSAGEKSSE